MNEHTPGPWRLENNIAYGWKTNPYSITVRKRGVHSVAVANIPAKQTITREEALANARLIAAAPDLLEALEAVICGVPDTWEAVKNARQAIAKATGGEA